MNVTAVLTSIFAAAVFFGALGMIVKNPAGANALVSAGVGGVVNTTRAFEGRATNG